MSQIAFCPKGGMSGLLVTEKELGDMALLLGRSTMDEVIPLPGLWWEQQQQRIEQCEANDHEDHGQQYWEVSETGAHGWCCSYCGIVLQWG